MCPSVRETESLSEADPEITKLIRLIKPISAITSIIEHTVVTEVYRIV